MTIRQPLDRPWALVPAKDFAGAKSRLSPVLNGANRAMLAEAMLKDVLGVIAESQGFAGVLLVSSSREVARLGEDHGVATLLDPSEAGTGAAVQRGLDHLQSVGVGRCVVVLGDLPLLSTGELKQILAGLDESDVVLVPARRDGGTNILALSRPDLIAQQFGQGSRARHLRAAGQIGVRAKVLELKGAGHDVDVPADLLEIAGQAAEIHTRSVLRRLAQEGQIPREAYPHERIAAH